MAVHTVHLTRGGLTQYDVRQIDTGSDDGATESDGVWYNCKGAKTVTAIITINGSVTSYDVAVSVYTGGNWRSLASADLTANTAEDDFALDLSGIAERVYIRIHNVVGVGGEVYLDVTAFWG